MSLKVLIVASEVSPYAKSGGLVDVAGSLPKALQSAGVDVRVVFPKYKNIKEKFLDTAQFIDSFVITLGWRTPSASVYSIAGDVPTYMIENDHYFNRDGYYGYGDDNERFAFFSKAAIEFLNTIEFIPDIIHCNDWQSGPVCVYLKDIYSKFHYFSNIKTLFTIHNLQYQGSFSRDTLPMMGLNDGYFTADKLEFNNQTSYMKAGLMYADAISTVSNTYAYEIQTGEYGYGLDGVLRQRSDVLSGIVNGIDYSANDPATSSKIYCNFDINNLGGKKENKRRLQEELALPQNDVPLFSIISRLADQKGIKLVIEMLDGLLQQDVQFIVLGTGDGHYEKVFRDFEARYRDKVRSMIMFDDTWAQKIYAASDFFLMPSLFEPCGLGQLFAMSYGTVPIVRTTGGLVDTVSHFNPETCLGNGFAFHDYVSSGLRWAIDEALKVYYSDKWECVVRNAFSTRFSWDKSAQEYIDLYNKILSGN